MAKPRVAPILEIVAVLGEVSGPVRYPELYASVDRVFRTGVERDALGQVVRWLLREDLANLRAGGLYLTPEVDGIAQRARAALEAGDRAGARPLVTALGLDAEDPHDPVDDRAARLLLAPPVLASWPDDAARGWSLMHAAILAAASRPGTITASRVRQLWFDTEGDEADPGEVRAAVQRLAAAGVVTLRSGRLHLTRAGRRCRARARRRLLWSSRLWSGDQPVWATLAGLAEVAGADRADGSHSADLPALTAWLGEHGSASGRHARS